MDYLWTVTAREAFAQNLMQFSKLFPIKLIYRAILKYIAGQNGSSLFLWLNKIQIKFEQIFIVRKSKDEESESDLEFETHLRIYD